LSSVFQAILKKFGLRKWTGWLKSGGLTYGVAVQGTVPLNERFSLFGRAGIGRTSMQATRGDRPDRDETDPMVGVGVSYAFNRHWSIGADFSYLTKTEVSLYSFSARFNF